MIACNIRKNNKDFVILSSIVLKNTVKAENRSKKRSSSTSRNPIQNATRTRAESTHDDDFELSCTLEQKAKNIQRNNKDLGNRYLFNNK